MKNTFLGRDLRKAFDLTERKLQYWMEQGFIKPDLNNTQPRVYSLAEAVICGLTTYFVEKGGYYPAHAARIARLAYNAALYLDEHSQDKNYELEIREGALAHMGVIDQDGIEYDIFFLVKINVQDIDEVEAIKNLKWKTLHVYKIYEIIDNILNKLENNKNETVSLKPTEDVILYPNGIKNGGILSLKIDPVKK